MTALTVRSAPRQSSWHEKGAYSAQNACHERQGGGSRQRLELLLDAAADPDAVVRVLGVLRRRGCEIAAVDYRRADRHAPARFEVAFDAPARTGRRIEEWLANLVDVLEVRRA